MPEHPFWERTYADNDVSTFSKGPTVDIDEFYPFFPQNASVLDVGCGEGRNSVFMAGLGHQVDAFDISAAGVEKAVRIACSLSLSVNFFCCDLGEFIFEKSMTSSYPTVSSICRRSRSGTGSSQKCKNTPSPAAIMSSASSPTGCLLGLTMLPLPTAFLP